MTSMNESQFDQIADKFRDNRVWWIEKIDGTKIQFGVNLKVMVKLNYQKKIKRDIKIKDSIINLN